MLHKNKSLLRTFVRIFALVLVFSMMFVGCEEEAPKRDFPAVNKNPSVNNNSNTSKPNNNSNNNLNNNNNSNVSSNSGKKSPAPTIWHVLFI